MSVSENWVLRECLNVSLSEKQEAGEVLKMSR
jgi:hypothetical protein